MIFVHDFRLKGPTVMLVTIILETGDNTFPLSVTNINLKILNTNPLEFR